MKITKIANMLADYHKECNAAETLREKGEVQLNHARLIRQAFVPPVISSSTNSRDKLSTYVETVMPHFFIGQEVKTEHGIGIIVAIEMPHNGLYIQPERAEAVVWYGTERAFEEGIKWVSFTYRLSELSAVENEA